MRPSIGWLLFVVALFFRLALPEFAQAQLSATEPAAQAVPESLRSLRFTAVHRVTGISYSDAAAFGEFSLEGPVINTLTPCANANAVARASDGRYFVVSDHGLLILDPKKPEKFLALDSEAVGRTPKLNAPLAGAFDEKRQRLIVQGTPEFLYCYDALARRWIWRKETVQPYLALAYVPEADEFLGIAEVIPPATEGSAFRRHPRFRDGRNAARMIQLDADANPISEVELSESVPVPAAESRIRMQAAYSDGHLMLLIPAMVQQHFGDMTRQSGPVQIWAIEAKSGKVVYTGESRLKLANGEMVSVGEPTPREPPAVQTIVDDLRKRVESARQRGVDMTEVDRRWRRLERSMVNIDEPETAEKAAEDRELHAVWFEASNDEEPPPEVVVNVTHQSHPITLVLGAYSSIHWKLRVEENARVETIILCGHEASQLIDPPNGAAVITRTYVRDPAQAVPGELNLDRSDAAIHLLLGVTPVSRVSLREPGTIEVGPGDASWRDSYIRGQVHEIDRALFQSEFSASRFIAIDRQQAGATKTSLLSTFSLTGPVAKGEVLPMPATNYLDFGGKSAMLVNNEVFLRSGKDATPTKLAYTDGVTPTRFTSLASNETGALMAFGPSESRGQNTATIYGRYLFLLREGKLAPQSQLMLDLCAVAFDAERGVYYGLELPTSSGRPSERVLILNARGAILHSSAIGSPFIWQLEAGPPQGVVVGRRLIVVTSPRDVVQLSGQRRLNSQILAIDPITGDTTFTGRIDSGSLDR